MAAKPTTEDVLRLFETLRRESGCSLSLFRQGTTWVMTRTQDGEEAQIFGGLPTGWAYVTLCTLVRWEKSQS